MITSFTILLRLIPKCILNYDDDSNKGCMFEFEVSYPKCLEKIHRDLPFLPPHPPCAHPPKKNNPETMNIDKCQKLVCNIYAKKKQCHSHESPKGGIGLRTSARRKRIWQLNSIKKHKGKKKTFNSNRYSNLLHSKLQ